MVSAEVQRIVLLVALAATAYLMVLAWNADYHQRPVLPGVSEAPAVTVPDVPDVGGAAPATPAPVALSDIPDASLVPGVAEPSAPREQTVSSDRLIRVDTGALSVWIDRLGGDIVRVQLPRFPLSLEQSEVPMLLLDNGSGHVYVAQSGLIGRDGPDAAANRPLYDASASAYAFREAAGEVLLTTTVDGVTIRKSFRFDPDDYVVGVAYDAVNERDAPFEAAFFAQLKRDRNEPFGQTHTALGPRPYLGAALTTASERFRKVSFDDLGDRPLREEVAGGWIGILQHYFLSAWVPPADATHRFYGHRRADGTYVVGFTSPVQVVAPGSRGHFQAQFYAGPKDQARLEALAPHLSLTVDYGFLWWLAVPLFGLLRWLHGVFGNWGVAIIVLTLIVKVVLYPLSAASYRSMANMRRVAPQIKRLQERYGDDRQKLSQEMMALYQKEKMNPLGGCLPMLLQMPVFLALYWVLFESVELRQAPFFGWIQDLSVMDPFFVLPILMGASMYFQMQLNPPPPDPMQAKVMKFLPVIFTVLFLFFPAGLVLYWLVNNVLSMAQQWFITRQVEGARSDARS
jgi:YidC/Oxa1 family membrane protein insertase